MSKPLNYETLAEVGDTIREYDFSDATDCYIEGIVTSKGVYRDKDTGAEICHGYEIKVTDRVTQGHHVPSKVGDRAQIPYDAGFFAEDWEGRIEKVS